MYVVCLGVCILGVVFVKEFIFKELVIVIFSALKVNVFWCFKNKLFSLFVCPRIGGDAQ